MKANARSRCGDSRSRLSAVKRDGVEKGNHKPKRPPNGFLLFMDGYRKDYKEGHPHIKTLGPVSKAGSKKWKSLTDAEKAPHVAKAEKLRAEYTKKMDTYKKSQTPYVTKAKKLKAEYTKKSVYKSTSESDEEDDSDDSSLSAKSNAEKGPNKPKRPLAAFFLFIEEFKKDYKENHPNIKRECDIRKAAGEVWKSLTDAKDPYLDKAKMLMVEYMEKVRAYNNWQEAQRRPATLDKSKSERDLQAGGPEASSDSDKYKSEIDLQAGAPEVPGDSDKSKSESDLLAGGPEASGDSDKYKSERDLQAGGPEAFGDSDKSKSGSDLQAGGSEAPDDSDKAKSESDLQAGGPEAFGDSEKSKSGSDLQAGGSEAPDDSDKAKSESDLQAGGPEASVKSKSQMRPLSPLPRDASGLVQGISADTGKSKPESNGKDDDNVVRPLHLPVASVLRGNVGRPRRQHGAAYRRLLQAATKVTICRRVRLSS